MHKIVQDANVINATAVDFPCGDPNKLEDLGIINEGILSGIKVNIFYVQKQYKYLYRYVIFYDYHFSISILF